MSLRTSREAAALESYKAARERQAAEFRAMRRRERLMLWAACVAMAVGAAGMVFCFWMVADDFVALLPMGA